MLGAPETAHKALRILRRVRTSFTDGYQKNGSGFVGTEEGTVITCAHVVGEPGKQIREVSVNGKSAKVRTISEQVDLAILECDEEETSRLGDTSALDIADDLLFAGIPAGVSGPSVFSGILSARGKGLVEFPKCDLLQINGMINSGNSGGPVFKVGSTEVLAVITAKFVPLLREIDNLREILRSIPQFPSEVAVGQVDFAKFVNLTVEGGGISFGPGGSISFGPGGSISFGKPVPSEFTCMECGHEDKYTAEEIKE